MSIDVQRATTAYHEAGHIVMAHSLQIAVGGVTLERQMTNGVWREWSGNAETGVRSNNTGAIRQIAMAGPFAELKYQALLEGNSAVTFDLRDDLLTLCQRLSTWNGGNVDFVLVAFLASTGPVSVTLPKLLHDDIAKLIGLANVRPSDQEIVEVLRNVREFLNEPNWWNGIDRVAKAALNAPTVPVERHSIDGKFVNGILNSE